MNYHTMTDDLPGHEPHGDRAAEDRRSCVNGHKWVCEYTLCPQTGVYELSGGDTACPDCGRPALYVDGECQAGNPDINVALVIEEITGLIQKDLDDLESIHQSPGSNALTLDFGGGIEFRLTVEEV